ncbi:MAG: hypothetical protein GX595_13385 [Lentisphaerae bacterium]|nr:hypothetical protein [Lentisphaerota bacterium]
MSPRNNTTQRHPMQLQELLVAMALSMVIAGLALDLAGRTWRTCRDAAEQARFAQQSLLLRQGWQRFVHECPRPPALTPAGRLEAGDWSATVQAGQIELRRGDEVRSLPLPEGMTAAVVHEDPDSASPSWTLLLTWHSRPGRPPRHGSSRVVACRQPEGRP